MARVYVPCQLQVQVAPDDDHPNGYIVTLNQGYVELPPGLENHPVIKHLMPQSEAAAARQQQLYDAQVAHDAAVAESSGKLYELRSQLQQQETEEMTKAEEEWAQKADEAAAAGVQFTEPHPNPDVQNAVTMTSPSSPVTASSMARVDETEQQSSTRAKLD
jgi:hypothetical protein